MHRINFLFFVLCLFMQSSISIRLSVAIGSDDNIFCQKPAFSVPNQSGAFIFTSDLKLVTCQYSNELKATSTSGSTLEKFDITKNSDGTYTIYNSTRKKFLNIRSDGADCSSTSIKSVLLNSLTETSYTISASETFLSYASPTLLGISKSAGLTETFYFVKPILTQPLSNVLPSTIIADITNSKVMFRFATGLYMNANNLGPRACPESVMLTSQAYTGGLISIFYGTTKLRNFFTVSVDGKSVTTTPQFDSQFSWFTVTFNGDGSFWIKPFMFPNLYLGYHEDTLKVDIFSQATKYTTYK